eukprot:12934314-Prorocentrum_lima.AAC.1
MVVVTSCGNSWFFNEFADAYTNEVMSGISYGVLNRVHDIASPSWGVEWECDDQHPRGNRAQWEGGLIHGA